MITNAGGTAGAYAGCQTVRTMRWPDFLVIGAYNCSTTSLRRELAQHPQLFLPAEPEPSYFAFDGAGGWPRLLPPAHDDPFRQRRTTDADDYRRLFGGARIDQLVGECSPEYLREPGSAARIHAQVPGVRCIAVLRDPVARAWSDHLLHVRDGLEHRTFEEAVAAPAGAIQPDGALPHLLETGRYAAQLEPYLHAFGADQVLVLILEEWDGDRAGLLATVCRFLGVDPSFSFAAAHRFNATGVPGSAGARAWYRLRRRLRPIVPVRLHGGRTARRVDALLGRRLERPEPSEAVVRSLAAHYADDVRALEGLLGRHLPWPTAEAARR